jgi:drug/metabolite transporter (DMT)-like permease
LVFAVMWALIKAAAPTFPVSEVVSFRSIFALVALSAWLACYRYADASVIASFDCVAMVWAAAIGCWAFAEASSPRVALGAGVVFAAGVAMLWREDEARKISLASAPPDARASVRARSIFRTTFAII